MQNLKTGKYLRDFIAALMLGWVISRLAVEKTWAAGVNTPELF
jgi:hypothetical protein